MKREYRTPAEQREKCKAYYWEHREQLLAYQKELRKQQATKPKKHNTLEEFYEDWNLYLIERLQTKKIPKWIQRGMILQIMHNNNTLNQYEQTRQTKPKR